MNTDKIIERSDVLAIVNCRLPQEYWRDGDVGVLFNGKAEEVLPLIESESIDLTVTSPPYDNLRTYNGYSWDFETIAKELYRVTKPGGVCVWVVGDQTIGGSETLTSAKQKIFFREGCGWNIHDTMIYEKGTAIPLNEVDRFNQEFEYMIALSKGRPKTAHIEQVPTKNPGKQYRVKRNNATSNGGGAVHTKDEVFTTREYKNESNIWRMNGVSGFEYQGHPAAFPEELALRQVRVWSNIGDTVLDCFMGSGTTAKAAKLLKRKWVGIEISDIYCSLIRRRLNPPMPLFDSPIAML